jgi:hypothetical protein
MDTQTIDQEYEKLQIEFADVAKTVTALAEKMKAAATAGDANATTWLDDLKLIAQDVSDEQTQATVLLQAIHGFITNAAKAADDEPAKPPLYAAGQEPQAAPQQPQQQQGFGRRGGLFGGGMMGGGMMGGYMGGGFAQAMEMGAGISLGEGLIGSLFHL